MKSKQVDEFFIGRRAASIGDKREEGRPTFRRPTQEAITDPTQRRHKCMHRPDTPPFQYEHKHHPKTVECTLQPQTEKRRAG